jgi:hypothetical protein
LGTRRADDPLQAAVALGVAADLEGHGRARGQLGAAGVIELGAGVHAERRVGAGVDVAVGGVGGVGRVAVVGVRVGRGDVVGQVGVADLAVAVAAGVGRDVCVGSPVGHVGVGRWDVRRVGVGGEVSAHIAGDDRLGRV